MDNITIARLHSESSTFQQQLSALLSRDSAPEQLIIERVNKIINEVRERGDAALLEYTNRLDRRAVACCSDFIIPRQEMVTALENISAPLREGLACAADRIKRYHEKQKLASWSYQDAEGAVLGQQVTALDRVGVYVPGGKAAYPSSVLMNVLPAVVAGVPEVVMVVPAPEGKLNDLVLAAAQLAEVSSVFTIGGAQAIAALAYGTETIPKVDKIVGPGNIYVATAKRMVFGAVGIDMIAGPSEILIVGDTQANPDWLAMDMLAQAEHDEHAAAILVSPYSGLLDAVEESIKRLLPELDRAAIITQALNDNSALIQAADLSVAADIVNHIAPEHLQLSLSEPRPFLQQVRHAGAIFVGEYSAEVFGDYCSGPNHVLPTARTARFSSPLGVYDFQKRSSLIMCNAVSAARLAETASILARGEGLMAHARSAEYRLQDK